MGREIRKVPKDWVHPKETKWNGLKQCEITAYMPKYDRDYDTAAAEWIA